VLVTGASAGFRDGKFTGGWWNVKNSWGDWGDGGYIKIEMDFDPGAKG
jgi:C1A family cysteine protease